MREIRIGKPTVTEDARKLVTQALDEGRVSEGRYTALLEARLSDLFSSYAIVTNSGHSALMLALRTAHDLYGIRQVITTPITFISTASAALGLGIRVVVTDTKPDSFLMDTDQVKVLLDRNRFETAYLPVHLFGYPVEEVSPAMAIQDACEALGSRRPHGALVGTGGLGCFSFYTSHVLGAGEMGFVLAAREKDATYIRKLKDQGRHFLRPHGHVDQKADIPPCDRYRHDVIGWNLRTTDLQSALILGNLPKLDRVIDARYRVVAELNRRLAGRGGLILPEANPKVSYLGYPIICRDRYERDILINELDKAGIETRPIMSLLPREEALKGFVHTPFGYKNAEDVHARAFYVSCHDTLSQDDVAYMADQILRAR